MIKLFQPGDGPVWLRPFADSIVRAFKSIMDAPFRLWPVATADLPTASENTYGLVYDLTTNRITFSNGTSWNGLQNYDATLAALAALDSSAGFLVQTGADTFTKRSLSAPAAGLTIANPAGTAGDATFALANDLAAVEGLASTGFAARTGTDTWAVRTLAAPAAGFTITNPAGTAGNPTFVLANDLAALEALSGTNTIYYRSAIDTWTAVTIGAGLGFSAGTLDRAALTGDVTASAGGNAMTLATVNSNVGPFGSATQVGTFTVNAKGLTTAAANVTITPAVGSITGLGTGVATALAINVGSAGAFITFNGAGGTPSSLTLTNATGLPISGLTASTVTAIGVGSIELGHATDTTIARSGAGDITIEGNAVYRAGGPDVPVADGGTGRSTSTTAYGLLAAGTTATGAHQTLAAGATTEILVGGGAAALPVWTTATGSGAPVRAVSPSLTGSLTATQASTGGHTFNSQGVVLHVNSSNSNGFKIALEDAGSAIGYFGGTATGPMMATPDLTVRLQVSTAGIDVTGESRCDTLRIDGTATAGTPVPTHTVPININGTVYRFPCVI